MVVRLTKEQEEVLRTFRREDCRVLRIDAFAGSGKTTMLEELVKRNSDLRFIIFAFNNSIAKELRRRIPSADCYTIHAYALRELKKKGLLPGELVGGSVVNDVAELLDCSYSEAKIYLDFFRVFCLSDLPLPEGKDEWKVAFSSYLRNFFPECLQNYKALKRESKEFFPFPISKAVAIIYQAMKEGEIPYTHDFYLKYFVLEHINSTYYDVVMVDEAQDLNPVQVEFIKKLSANSKLVLVGDRHQSIYGWRGSVDSLSLFNPDAICSLTFSFRFSLRGKVHEYANFLLKNLKLEPRKIIPAKSKEIKGEAYIFRTNSKLLDELYERVCWEEPARLIRPLDEIARPLKIGAEIVGYLVGLLDEDGLRLSPKYAVEIAKQVKKDCALLELNREECVELLAQRLEKVNKDLAVAVVLASNYKFDRGISVWEMLDDIRRIITKKPDVPLFATAHTVKGLEFKDVRLAEDFPSLPELCLSYFLKNIKDEKKALKRALSFFRKVKGFADIKEGFVKPLLAEPFKNKLIIDEINLVYVAITRASGTVIFADNIETYLVERSLNLEISTITSTIVKLLREKFYAGRK